MSAELSLLEKCEIAIAQLKLQMPENHSPLYPFHNNQTNIAIIGFNEHEKFENPEWLLAVLLDFINAYLNKSDDWINLIEKVNRRAVFRPIKIFLAQREMAFYHIKHDLPNSLARFGCGSENDWLRLEKVIKRAIDMAGYSKIMNARVKWRIIKLRNEVRDKIIAQNKKSAA